jgi:hypothetical protein
MTFEIPAVIEFKTRSREEAIGLAWEIANQLPEHWEALRHLDPVVTATHPMVSRLGLGSSIRVPLILEIEAMSRRQGVHLIADEFESRLPRDLRAEVTHFEAIRREDPAYLAALGIEFEGRWSTPTTSSPSR